MNRLAILSLLLLAGCCPKPAAVAPPVISAAPDEGEDEDLAPVPDDLHARMAAQPWRPDPALYPEAPLERVAAGKWVRPRAFIIGTVTLVRHEADGDWHIKVESGGKFVVCEISRNMVPAGTLKPLAPPTVGDTIAIWGIVRPDNWPGHGWYEIHDVHGWHKQ